ncbi:MAG: HAD family hydrolase [Verrucomicrobiota bacterium]
MQKRRLLLFDIDGTLINSGGAGVHALQIALFERCGIKDDLCDIEIAGRTDSGIVWQILQKYGTAPTDENVSAFLGDYIRLLSLELPERNGRLLPGILELLKRLKKNPQLVLALLTGNIARGAEMKLKHYGIWDFFEFGAFADDDRDRSKLGGFAQARALAKYGREFPGADIDVIGDTPHDIAGGKVINARTIAVATGSYSREQLAKHQPDFIFDDLSQVAAVMQQLGWRCD